MQYTEGNYKRTFGADEYTCILLELTVLNPLVDL